MSKPGNKFAAAAASTPPPFTGPEGATVTKPVNATCVVRTTKGYAVGHITIGLDGQLTVRIGPSQSWRMFVEQEHRRTLSRLAHAV